MKRLITALIVLLTLGGCALPPAPTPVVSVPTSAPTQTSQPTYTPVPTYTPSATPTPVPPTATATATALPTAIPTSTATPTRVPTAKPTSAPTSAPPAVLPPTGMVHPAPKLVQPPDGAALKGRTGYRMNSITFEWLPVGALENGKIRCSWKDQPSGTEAAIFDRYIVKFDPPMNKDTPSWDPTVRDTLTDAGTQITVELFRFRSDVTYTWRVVVGRWCATITPGVNRDSFMNLISPYSESRTFRYTP